VVVTIVRFLGARGAFQGEVDMKVVRKLALGTVALVTAIGGSVLVAGPAAAHEGEETFPVDCGDSGVFELRTHGNGEFTAAQDVHSNTVLVPVAFGDFTGVITDAEGNVVDSFTEPGVRKGSGKQKFDATCTFAFTFVSDGSDPEFPAGFTFTGSGTADVKIRGGGPRR
jgi:hypothetical protein